MDRPFEFVVTRQLTTLLKQAAAGGCQVLRRPSWNVAQALDGDTVVLNAMRSSTGKWLVRFFDGPTFKWGDGLLFGDNYAKAESP